MALRLCIAPEREEDADQVERLMDLGFGKDRLKRAAYTLRQPSHAWEKRMSFVALDQQGQTRGAIRFWAVRLDGDLHHVLLGPLAMDPRERGKGIGTALISRGLEAARARGWQLCFVIGAPEIYRRFGFCNAHHLGFRMPVPEDSRKFQVLELSYGALSKSYGSGTLKPRGVA